MVKDHGMFHLNAFAYCETTDAVCLGDSGRPEEILVR